MESAHFTTNPDPHHHANTFKLGSIGARFIAALVDVIILAAVNGSLTMFAVPGEDLQSQGAISGLGLLMNLLYFMLMESSSYQATVGKMVVNLKVVDEQGQRLKTAQAAKRALGRTLSGIILGIGFLVALFNNENRTLHDMLAKTRVITDEKAPVDDL